jgi:transposase, IS5 family
VCSNFICHFRPQMRRRSAIEPVIGHLKNEHHMDRNYLAGRHGDANNAILAAVGYNFRRLIRWLRFLFFLVLVATRPPPKSAAV